MRTRTRSASVIAASRRDRGSPGMPPAAPRLARDPLPALHRQFETLVQLRPATWFPLIPKNHGNVGIHGQLARLDRNGGGSRGARAEGTRRADDWAADRLLRYRLNTGDG